MAKFYVEVSDEDAVRLEDDLNFYGNCFITIARGAKSGERLDPVHVKIEYSGKSQEKKS